MPYENVRLLGKFRKKSQLAADLQVRRRPDLTDMLHSLSLQQRQFKWGDNGNFMLGNLDNNEQATFWRQKTGFS